MISAAPARIASFLRLPLFVRIWLIPLWCLLGVARALILFVPFRRLAPLLGTGVAPGATVTALSRTMAARAVLIGRAIRLAAKYTPWTSNCFPQAIVARMLLGLYGMPYALDLGVRRAAGTAQLEAHAWVRAGDVVVTGRGGSIGFTVVGTYVARVLAPSGQRGQ